MPARNTTSKFFTNVAVAWQGPGISQQVIAGNYLSPFVPAGGGNSVANVSINEDEISLYPNPSNKGRFTIILPEISENAKVKIFDNQGRMVYEKSAHSNKKIEVDSQLKPGLYIVRINCKGYSFTKRLIVN